jgi:hypothetical protein
MNQKTIVRNIQSGEWKAVWKVDRTLSIFECCLFYILFCITDLLQIKDYAYKKF